MLVPRQLYSPIVKGKMWDLKALGGLSSQARLTIKPLIEAMPLHDGRSVNDHIEKFTHYIRRFYPLGSLFVDFYGFLPGATTADGEAAVIAGFRLLKAKGRSATPVYGFDRDDALWSELREVVECFGEGFCFRIDTDDLDDAAESTWEQILQRSAELGLRHDTIDLMIDLRDVRETDVVELRDRVIDFVSMKPFQFRPRSLVVAGSSALKTVMLVPANGEADVERRELRLWSAIQLDLLGSQEVVYGDYGVIHPEFADVGPNPHKNGKIRYTSGVNIRYFRGSRLDEPPKFAQFHELAARVRNSSFFIGRAFSLGDAYIDDVANMRDGPGHLGAWVRADMNHHMEYTAKQMERLRVAIQRVSSLEAAEQLLLAR